jgi:GR25 family glycosyltransferase involved in LPS biosynthesis
MHKFIIHHPKLSDRRAYIESCRLNDICFITKYNDGSCDPISTFNRYVYSKHIWDLKCKGKFEFRLLNKGDIACIESHIEAWNRIAKLDDYAMVLEDDVQFSSQNSDPAITGRWFEQFVDGTNPASVMSRCPKPFDVLFIGGTFPHNTVSTTVYQTGNFHRKDHPATNTAFAYIIGPSAAKKLCKIALSGYSMPVDFEMNYWFDALDFIVYHHIPYIVTEGSATNVYKSSQLR